MIDALVTGAGGFIGQALCASLRTKGWTILPLVRANGDIADTETWRSLPPTRVVFHLAGRTFVPDSWERSPDFVSANVTGTEHALAYCRAHGARLVLASGYVYGIPQRLPISETDPAQPNNPYALTKCLSEQLCEFSSMYQGVNVTVLRIFNVFGPGQRAEFLIPKILQQVEAGSEIRLLDLAPRRDYVYLSDVVDAFIKAGDISTGFQLVNIGSGQSLSVADIVDKIQIVAGTRLPVTLDSVERRNEIPDVVADISLANRLLGWQPQLSFEAGIAQLLRRV
jgi:GDP-4-dehydro-6-deoxy-D-mannose reductase